jgi:hypothetical protein
MLQMIEAMFLCDEFLQESPATLKEEHGQLHFRNQISDR